MRDASADRLIQKTISQRMREPSGNCADENTTAAYLEDGLSPQEKTAFESHVSECASCQEILALSMKLRAEEEEIGQTAEEPRIGKKTLFHFSIPVPVLAGVFVSVVLIAVLFRMLYQPGVQKPLTAELRPPIQKTETRIPAIPMEPPVVSKDRPAKGGSTVQTQAVDNKAKESEFLNRQAAMESFRPAAPAAAVESDAAVPPESSMQKTAGALASMEPAHDRSAALPSPAAVLNPVDVSVPSTVALNSLPPKDMILGFKGSGSKLEGFQSRQIGDKVFFLNAGFWVDRQCTEHRDEPIIEILPAIPEHGAILAKYPELRGLLPAVIYWNNKNYLLR